MFEKTFMLKLCAWLGPEHANTFFQASWVICLACCLVDILDEHYSFRDFFSKLCYALRWTCQKGPSKLLRRWKQTFVSVRAFWSLEPQAYFATTPFQPQVMMHKRIFRPHFAVSTCCTVLSSHVDDSLIQYEALFLLSMKSQEQTSYCSYLLQMHHISSQTCSSDRPLFVWT